MSSLLLGEVGQAVVLGVEGDAHGIEGQFALPQLQKPMPDVGKGALPHRRVDDELSLTGAQATRRVLLVTQLAKGTLAIDCWTGSPVV